MRQRTTPSVGSPALANRHDLRELLSHHGPLCVSIYQPTTRNHTHSEESRIRFKDHLKFVEEALSRRGVANGQREELLKPLHQLAQDHGFWRQQRDGLGVFCRPGAPGLPGAGVLPGAGAGFFRHFQFLRPVPDYAVVAESFHVKPLVRILQDTDRYQVLGVSIDRLALWEGNRDVLDEIALHPRVPRNMAQALNESPVQDSPNSFLDVQKHRDERKKQLRNYFRRIDDAIWEHHSRSSRLPLILAAIDEHQAIFRDASHNPQLLPEGLTRDPFKDLSVAELRQLTWQLIEPRHQERLRELAESFAAARAHRQGSDNLADVAKAAAMGRVGTLLVEAERRIDGRLDPATGQIVNQRAHAPDTDDLLDDISTLVLRSDGDVLVVPRAQMPTDSGVAAIGRYPL